MPLHPDPDATYFEQFIRDVPDFPKSGIVFKDLSPLIEDPEPFSRFIDRLAHQTQLWKPDKIVAVDARGFLFGGALAYKLGKGLVMARKKGKLPFTSISVDYELEYGSATMEMHADAIKAGEKVMIVDDLLATGGTVAATCELCKQCGAELVGAAFLIELCFLNGRSLIGELPIFAPVQVQAP